MPSAYERIPLTAMRSRTTYCTRCFRLRARLCSFATLVKLDETPRTGLGKQREERKREALSSVILRREYPAREKTERTPLDISFDRIY